MIINIVTPCSRPENLFKISDSINIPRDHYRWVVVFDSHQIPNIQLPTNAEYYAYKDLKSISGNAQRNYANTLINDGYVMIIDDDTILHPDLWEAVKEYNHDVICWKQANKDGTHRLNAGKLTINNIDSGSFMVKRSIIGEIKWRLNVYGADGFFAEDVAKVSASQKNIDSYLSVYNYLR